MAPSSSSFCDKLPPIYADEEVDDAASGERVLLCYTPAAKKRPTRSLRLSPSKGKSGPKRAASDMTKEVKGMVEGKTAMNIKKKKPRFSSSSDVAIDAEGIGAGCAPVVVPTATAVAENQESKKISRGRAFSEENDVVILERVIEYRAMTGLEPSSDPRAFFDFVKGSLLVEMSKPQVMDKIRSLLLQFRLMAGKYSQNEEPSVAPLDLKVFDLSTQIWGVTDSTEGSLIEDDILQSKHTVDVGDTSDNKKPLTPDLQKHNSLDEHQETESVKAEDSEELGKDTDQQGLVAVEPKSNAGVVCDGVVEEEGDGKESRGGNADDFWARHIFLKGGIDMMVSRGMLGGFPESLLLEKAKGFDQEKRKEWDLKWKALFMEEMQLHITKLKLESRFSMAALDELKK